MECSWRNLKEKRENGYSVVRKGGPYQRISSELIWITQVRSESQIKNLCSHKEGGETILWAIQTKSTPSILNGM